MRDTRPVLRGWPLDDYPVVRGVIVPKEGGGSRQRDCRPVVYINGR